MLSSSLTFYFSPWNSSSSSSHDTATYWN